MFVASNRPIPGYTTAVSGVGMFGLGITQGTVVLCAVTSRRQPSVLMIRRSSTTGPPVSRARYSALNISASSPTVIPCWRMISSLPTPEVKPGCIIGPRA
jgi:hypothetical protein